MFLINKIYWDKLKPKTTQALERIHIS